ncbi:MAG TPA: hypothetical protein VEC11_09180 [Allosphingosinicella sp.]|nr:hypothetical protein [Allosphingosinicella sp.]
MAHFALLLALLAQAAAQPDWRSLGTSGNGRQTSYDAASVVRAGPITRVRLRFVEEGSYTLSNMELRCAAYEARVLGIVTYSPEGAEQSRNETSTPFRAVVVGSFLETLAREVCGAAQAPARPQ